jgi:hypothetical protein
MKLVTNPRTFIATPELGMGFILLGFGTTVGPELARING